MPTIKLPNKVYNVAKWLVMIVSPLLVTLLVSLGALYGWTWTDTAGQTITIVTAFLGGILGISSYQYKKGEDTNE